MFCRLGFEMDDSDMSESDEDNHQAPSKDQLHKGDTDPTNHTAPASPPHPRSIITQASGSAEDTDRHNAAIAIDKGTDIDTATSTADKEGKVVSPQETSSQTERILVRRKLYLILQI